MRFRDVADPDGALVEGLRRGVPAAFDGAYARWRPRLYAFLLRMTGDGASAEDLLQETWIRLARAALRLAPDTDLRAWLFTVARNLVTSQRRWTFLRADRAALEVAAQPGPADSPFDATAAGEAQRTLERALRALRPREREAILLVSVEGLEPVQAARVVGISPEALRQRLARARARLREALDAPRPGSTGEESTS